MIALRVRRLTHIWPKDWKDIPTIQRLKNRYLSDQFYCSSQYGTLQFVPRVVTFTNLHQFWTARDMQLTIVGLDRNCDSNKQSKDSRA